MKQFFTLILLILVVQVALAQKPVTLDGIETLTNKTLISPYVANLLGSSVASGTLTLQSTSNATKGKIIFGTSAYDEVNNWLGIGTIAPVDKLTIIANTPGGISFSKSDNTWRSKIEYSASGDLSLFSAAGSAGPMTTGLMVKSISGNVLIGSTTDAGYKLDVAGTGRFTGKLDHGTGATVSYYNTSDQTTNYERVRKYWYSNQFNMISEAGGTGLIRNMAIGSGGTSLVISASGIVPGIGSYAGFYFDKTNTSIANVSMIGSTLTGSAGVQTVLTVASTVNQTSTGGYKGILVTPYEQATGSGSKLLLDLGTNSAANNSGTHTSKFSVNSTGQVVLSLPATSGGTYDILSRNTSNGIIEKIASSSIGTVSNVSVTTANGVSGSVVNTTTTPAITLTLGAITPSSVNGVSATTMGYLDVTSSVQGQLNSKVTAASPTFTGTVTGITKSMVQLGNVDNTSDASKPVSNATQAALDLKVNAATSLTGYGITDAAKDVNVVHNSGDESISGSKSFTASPILPPATENNQAINLGQLKQISVVKPDGIVMAGNITFNDATNMATVASPFTVTFDNVNKITNTTGTNIQLTQEDAVFTRIDVIYAKPDGSYGFATGGLQSTQLEPSIPTGTVKLAALLRKPDNTTLVRANSPIQYFKTTGGEIDGRVTILSGEDLVLKAAPGSNDNGDLIFQNGDGVEKGRIWKPAGADELRARFVINDLGKKIVLENDLETLLHKAGDEKKDGILTFTSSPVIPNGVNAGDAVNKSQLDSKMNASDYVVPTISGDIVGTGTGNIITTLATVNPTPGTFNNVYVNAKGLVTSASNITYQTPQTSLSGYGIADAVNTKTDQMILGAKNFSMNVYVGEKVFSSRIEDPYVKLFVNGKIKTKAILVDPKNWADYVFNKDYKLPSLRDIEAYIKINKHLPEVPTTAEVNANGVNLGEMNEILLKKVEELTLHLIDKDKQMSSQEERIKKLEDALLKLTEK